MAIIEDPRVIEKILKHLRLWDPCPLLSPAPPSADLDWPVNS